MDSKLKLSDFKIDEEVMVTNNPPNLGSWTWMDKCRLERKGQKGIVTQRDYSVPPVKCPCRGWNYRVLFKDGVTITFVEEYLERPSQNDWVI